MHSSLIAWIMRAIPFGTIIMYGALGETVTEKSGNLNLGVPGIMYLGGFAGFASAWAYENSAANPNGFVSILIALSCAILASMAGGLIYAFLTISLRANQNVTGLALTTFGMGVANFFGVFILNGASYSAAPVANKAFSAKIPVLSGLGDIGQVVFSYGFLVYAAILLAVVLHWFLTRTRAGLNLRAVGENPATADAAGINVTRHRRPVLCTGLQPGHLGDHRPDRGAGLAGRGAGHFHDLEAAERHLGRVPVRYALLAVPVSAVAARHHDGQPHHRPCADAALRCHDHRPDRRFDAQEEGEPAPGSSGSGLLPRGAVRLPSPVGEGGRGPARGRMRGGLVAVAREWEVAVSFALISRLRATASPEGEAL